MTHLLLIDDEPAITEPLTLRLKARGYEVSVANDGEMGLAHARALDPDLVVLDVMMPRIDGWEVCKQLRAESTVPILMLTALNDDFDRVLGLEVGADDYLTKPFSMNVLVARINALLRRVELDRQKYSAEPRVLEAGPLSLDLTKRVACVNSKPLKLRFKEFELLSLLVANVGTPVTRSTIFNEVWGTEWLGDTRTLDVHVRWLRQKLEADPSKPKMLCTVRNVGYMFKVD